MTGKAAHNAALIRRTLRIDEDQYALHVLEEGMRYLDLYLGKDTVGREVLRDLPSYWQWWTKQWDQRNAAFIVDQHLEEWAAFVGRWERTLLTQLYNELHAADRVEARPTRKVMRETVSRINQRLHGR